MSPAGWGGPAAAGIRAAGERRRRAGVPALVLAVLLAVLLATAPDAGAAVRIGDLLPPITLDRMGGVPARIPEHFRGKVLVLHFWQMGCSSCRLDMPAMDGLYRRYRGKGLEILAVNVGQGRKEVKAYAANLGVSYPILVDPEGRSASLLDVNDIPRTYIVDRSGVVKYRILGSATPETLKRLIESLL